MAFLQRWGQEPILSIEGTNAAPGLNHFHVSPSLNPGVLTSCTLTAII